MYNIETQFFIFFYEPKMINNHSQENPPHLLNSHPYLEFSFHMSTWDDYFLPMTSLYNKSYDFIHKYDLVDFYCYTFLVSLLS